LLFFRYIKALKAFFEILTKGKKMKKFLIILFLFITTVYSIDKEPNNTCNKAVKMIADESSQGTISKNDKNDFYYFTAPLNGTLMINASGSDFFVITVYKNSCKKNNIIDRSKTITYQNIFQYQKGDKFYIKIHYPKGSVGKIIYSLETTFIPLSGSNTNENENSTIVNTNERDFAIRYKANIYGNLQVIGNTVLCVKDNTGKCIDYNGDKTNAELDLKYVDVDNNSSTFDSSSAYLDIPDDANITFVGFYSQGYIDNTYSVQDAEDKLLAKKIDLTFESGLKISFYPQLIDLLTNYDGDFLDGFTYSTFKELKTLEGKKAKALKGLVTAANIYANEGKENSGLGNYGAWTLVVVYQDPNDKYRNITIYDGYKKVSAKDNIDRVDIHLSGFITPLHGDIDSKLSLFVGEGDKNIPGDKLLFDNNDISHKDNNGKDNAFYSVITGGPDRNPSLQNNNGIDIQNYNIGTNGLNLLEHGQESADITLTSTQDTYFPNMIAFSTQIYVPKVCYTDIEYYDKNGNKITSAETGDTVMVKIHVINDANETAKFVYIHRKFDENLTSYVRNSTSIKNVLTDKYVNIPDNSSNGNLAVEYNESSGNWRIGIIGDDNNEFLPYSENPDYIAGIEFNTTINQEGNLSFDFYTDYKYDIGGKEYSYNDILPKCSDFNDNLNVKWVATGGYDAWDTTGNINDRNISTKIVALPFTITVASLNSTNDGLETKQNVDANVTIVDVNLTPLADYQTFNSSVNKEQNLTFNISKAEKRVKVEFKVCGQNVGGNLRLYPLDQCDHDCAANETAKCFHKLFSTDEFAIRPDRFIITNNTAKIKAGSDINLTVQAIGADGAPAQNYNETLHFSTDRNSPYAEVNETKPGCTTGHINIRNLHFVNGKAELNATYSEVGDINFTIKEINGSEFANVDTNDTNDSERFITPGSIILHVLPHHFAVSASYSNFNSKNFTYISNELNMSSLLNITITAQNEQNGTTQNYNVACYAKPFDINISHSVPSGVNLNILYKDKFGSEQNVSITSPLRFTSLPASYFTTANRGVAHIPVNINFEKKYNTPVNEFNFTIKDINVSDVNGTFGTFSLDQNATFRYGSIIVNNVSGYDTKELNFTAQYMYYKNNTWKLNMDHNSTDFGEINLSKSIKPSDITLNVIQKSGKNVYEGVEKIKAVTTHALPYSAKVHLSIPSWLWYHPLATKYEDPSSSNLNCLTHPCVKLTFLKSGKGWAGIGRNSVKYNEQNVTVETNLSKETNISKEGVKKLNW
jgi:hypothetical protein